MIFEKVKAIICNEMNVDPSKVTMETNLSEDLDADSLDYVELIMAIEEEFGLEVNEELSKSIRTVSDIVKMLEENGN